MQSFLISLNHRILWEMITSDSIIPQTSICLGAFCLGFMPEAFKLESSTPFLKQLHADICQPHVDS